MPLNPLFQTIRARQLWRNPFAAFSYFVRLRACPANTHYYGNFFYRNHPIVARPTDWWALDEVLINREYEFLLPLFNEFKNPTVFDVGANIGMFGLWVLSNCPGCHVQSLEASHSTYEVLEKNRQLNPSFAWAVTHAALWRHDGFVAFEDRAFSTSSRVAFQATDGPRVPAITMKKLLGLCDLRPVHLVKMDIEGAEEAAICGQEASLAEVQNLVIELHPNLCDTKKVVSSLRSEFPFLYSAKRSHSSKPMIWATRQKRDLPVYVDA